MKLKKDDTVKIIAGKDKGVVGKIIKVTLRTSVSTSRVPTWSRRP